MSNNKSNFQQSHVRNLSNSYNTNFTRTNTNQQYSNQMNSRTVPMSVAQQSLPVQQLQQQQQVVAAAAVANQYKMFNSFSTHQIRQPQQAPLNHHMNKNHAVTPNYMLNPHLSSAGAHNYQPFYSPMPTNYAMSFQKMFQMPGPIQTAPQPHHAIQPPIVPLQSIDAIQQAQLNQQQHSISVSHRQSVPTQLSVPQLQQMVLGNVAAANSTAIALKKKSNSIRIRAPDQETNMKFNEWFEKNSSKDTKATTTTITVTSLIDPTVRIDLNKKLHEIMVEDTAGLATNTRSPVVNDVAADKVTPTVSANSKCAEVTVINKPSELDQHHENTTTSPIRSHKKTSIPIVIKSATDSAVVSIAALAGESVSAAATTPFPSPSSITITTPEFAGPTTTIDKENVAVVTETVNILSTGTAVDAVAAVTSGARLSKSQMEMPLATTATAVIENVPEKALSKTGREKDLNMRGDFLLMQGSDFDAFDFKEKLSATAPKEKQPKTLNTVAFSTASTISTTVTTTTMTTNTKKVEKENKDFASALKPTDSQLTFVAAANKVAPLPDICKPKPQQNVAAAGSIKSKSKTLSADSVVDNQHLMTNESKKSNKSMAASGNQKPKASSPTLPVASTAPVTSSNQNKSQQKLTTEKEKVAAALKPMKVEGSQVPVAQQPPQPSHKKTLTDISTGAIAKPKFDVTNIVAQMQTCSGVAGKKPVIPLYQQSSSSSSPLISTSIEQLTELSIDSKNLVSSCLNDINKTSVKASLVTASASSIEKTIEFPVAFKNPSNGTVLVFTSIQIFRKYNYVGINTPMANLTGPKRYTIEFAFEVLADKRCDWTPDYKFKSNCEVMRRTSKTRVIPSTRVLNYHFNGSRGSTGNSRQMGGSNKNSYSMSGRNSMQNMSSVSGGYQPKISLKLDLDEDVKLNTTKNAWKPSVLKSKQQSTVPASAKTSAGAASSSEQTVADTSSGAKLSEKHEQICKQIRSILNKLTAQNFDKLTKEALNCDISNEENLIETVCNLIYDKAITEACFSEMYANFCKQLSESKMGQNASSPDYASNKAGIFRKSLISRCQLEFHRKETIYDRLKEMEACTNPAEKRQMQLNFEEEERKVRRRTNGNIRFLGELYKVSLLNCGVMLKCIKTKLAVHEDHTIESLCKLITVVGETLENEAKSSEIQECFNTINRLIKNSKSVGIGQRVKFMMQDLVDLRNNKWKYVKAPKPNPLPLQASSSSVIGLSSSSSYASKSSGGASNQFNNQKRMTKPSSSMSGGIGSNSSGGSSSLSNNSSWKSVTSSLVVSKEKSSNLSSVRNQNLDTIKLGPGDFNWSTGSKINDKTVSGRSSSSATTVPSLSTSSTIGSFSFATTNPLTSHRPPPRLQSSSSIENKSRNYNNKNLHSVPVSNPAPISHTTTTTTFVPNTATTASVSTTKTTRNSIPVKTNVDAMIGDMFAHCSSGMELSKDPYFRETIEKVTPAVFINKFLMYMFEKTKVNFEVASRMLNEMLQKQWLSKSDVLNCLQNEIISNFHLLLDDAPLASDYLMQLLSDSIFSQTLTLQDLKKTIFDQMNIKGECYKCFRSLIAQFKKTEKGDLLRSMWNVQKYDVVDLIAASNLADFKNTPEAQFFNECLLSSASDTNNQKNDDFLRSLIKCLRMDSDPFDKSIDLIRTNMSVSVNGAAAAASNDTDTINALKMLVIAICHCSICKSVHDNASYVVNKVLIKEQWKIVRKYFNSNYEEKSEVLCLNAIVEFMESIQHPKGVWNEISYVLYECELISANAFLAWKNESVQTAGKAVAITSLRPFFLFLSGQLDGIVDKVKNTN